MTTACCDWFDAAAIAEYPAATMNNAYKVARRITCARGRIDLRSLGEQGVAVDYRVRTGTYRRQCAYQTRIHTPFQNCLERLSTSPGTQHSYLTGNATACTLYAVRSLEPVCLRVTVQKV
jgi:hypothetical protein